MRRKLLCVSMAMIFGIFAMMINLFLTVSIALAVFCYATVLCMKPELDECRVKALAFACLFAFAFGALRVQTESLRYPSGFEKNDDQVTVTARVIDTAHKKGGGVKLTAEIVKCGSTFPDEAHGEKRSKNREEYRYSENFKCRRCLISCRNEIGNVWELIGSEISFKGKVSLPDPARNPRCFDYRMYLKSKGIAFVSSVKVFRVIRDEPTVIETMKRKIYGLREKIINNFEKESAFSGKTGEQSSGTGKPGEKTAEQGDESAVIRGILFGDTSFMPDNLTEDFRRNGTAHILAVSGLHIGLLYGIFKAIRKKVHVPGMSFAFIIILMLYGTMTLWSVSVTRAVAMVMILEAGDHLDRRYDLITSLGLVSMLSLTVNPFALYSASFIMSYLAVASLAIIGPVIRSGLPDKVPPVLTASISVQAGLLPYTAYAFNALPIGAVIINIPVILIMSVLMSFAVAAIPVLTVTAQFTPLNAVVHQMIYFLVRIMVRINDIFAELEFLSPDVVSPPLWVLFMIYGVMFLLCSESFRISHIRERHGLTQIQAGLIAIAVMMSLVVSTNKYDKADIVMIDVGQGDSIHVKAGGHNYMIDGGGNEEYEVGRKVLKPYLLKNGVRKIDGAFVTHLHEDHYKGICELAREGMVRHLFVYAANRLKIKEICRDTGLEPENITFLRRGHRVRLGAWERQLVVPGAIRSSLISDTLEVLWPPYYTDDKYRELISDEADENASSLIMKVTVDGVSMLVTGDLGEEGENELIEQYGVKDLSVKDNDGNLTEANGDGLLHSNILKVGHHGSNTSSTDRFLDTISPEIAVIQVGKNNMYGHPAPETLNRLKSHSIKVWRNDLQGAVGIDVSEGKIKSVMCMLDKP